jgi:hypothetical protein
MSDIVERLLRCASPLIDPDLNDEAAVEIKRLRAELKYEIKRLRAELAIAHRDALEAKQDVRDLLSLRSVNYKLMVERDSFARALHEIAEEWAGAECGEPVHAQEAYAIALAKRMYTIAVEARKP